jgi:hypothetical protein
MTASFLGVIRVERGEDATARVAPVFCRFGLAENYGAPASTRTLTGITVVVALSYVTKTKLAS